MNDYNALDFYKHFVNIVIVKTYKQPSYLLLQFLLAVPHISPVSINRLNPIAELVANHMIVEFVLLSALAFPQFFDFSFAARKAPNRWRDVLHVIMRKNPDVAPNLGNLSLSLNGIRLP